MRDAQERRRWPYYYGQGAVLASAVAIFAGTALPWALLAGELRWGAAGALMWTLSGGFLALAGAMVQWRVPAALSALGGAAIALYFAIWQTARIFDRCLSLDCVPGPGLGFLLAGGLAAGYQALGILGVRVPGRTGSA